MAAFICATCGMQYGESDASPEHCLICEDERQYIGPKGQRWVTLSELQKGYQNRVEDIEPGLTGIGSTPGFAIGQRALLAQTPQGNLLWDCVSLLDDATVEAIQSRGGIQAIAVSHPHLAGSLVEWSRAFGNAPIYWHTDNLEWAMRPDPAYVFWEGETHPLWDGLTLVRCGGHFTGSAVLHWPGGAEGRGALLTGDTLTSTVIQALYDTTALGFLPEIIAHTASGDYGPLADLTSRLLSIYKQISYGMNASVQCAEEEPFTSPAIMATAEASHPDVSNVLGTANGPFALCKVWNVPAAAALENQPVTSSVPTLVLSGQFDPVTPPSWGKLVASNLSQSYFFEIPAAAHGSSLTETCPRRLVLAFLDSPTAAPDASCLKDMKLAFDLPAASLQVELAPFTNSQMGLSGQAPANWRTVGALQGFYSPSGQATDPTQLLIEALPTTADQFLQMINSNLANQGVTLSPTGEKRATPNLTFTLYAASAGLSKIDMALASSGGNIYVVLLQSSLGEHDALYQAVFLPVMNALKPNP